ncbi:glycosyltransferase family 2 protein [Enterococcus faecium]|uniref:glycosyltransferase family 2 protein n=1 Tax=Enterococcus faecium TaxID=1352 RepID=UPI003CC57ACE
MDNVKVSVIITTYGGEWKLKRAIHSILEQSYKNYEIIVVDDNPPKSKARIRTEEYLKQFVVEEKIKYIKHEYNKNGSAARNTGIKAACGEYLAFLDDDDYYLKDRLTVSFKYLEEHSMYDGVCVSVLKLKSGCLAGLVDSSGIMTLTPRDLIVNQNVLGTGSNIFVRKSLVDSINGFDEKFNRFQDVEFMIRFCEKYKVGFINQFLIVKDIAGYRVPSYEKIKASLIIFCSKFKNQIDALEELDKNRFWEDRFSYLFSLAIQGRNSKTVEEAKNQLKAIRTLSSREKLYAKYFKVLKPLIQLRKQIAERDIYIVRIYREMKNKKQYSDLIGVLKNDTQISKAYYYRNMLD